MAQILEFLSVQKRIFGYNRYGDVNVVFAKNFRKVIEILAINTRRIDCQSCLLLPTVKLEKHLANKEYTDFTRKYHPAWTNNKKVSDFDTTGIERIVATSANIKFVMSEFSSSMLYLHLYSGCVRITWIKTTDVLTRNKNVVSSVLCGDSNLKISVVTVVKNSRDTIESVY